jgi:hypothetical protein
MMDEAGFEKTYVLLYSVQHSFCSQIDPSRYKEGAENFNLQLNFLQVDRVDRLMEVTSSYKLGNVLGVFHQQYDIFLK